MELVTKPHLLLSLTVPILLLSGCRPIMVPFDEKVPAQNLSYVGAPPVVDARVRFRPIFCDLLRHRVKYHEPQLSCDDFLWKLIDEPASSILPANLPKHDPSFVILMVPGAFSECVGDIGKPFQEPAARLRKLGYRIMNVDVSGLSSSSKNAEIIAQSVANEKLDPSQRLILLGHSKGTTDILHFLVDYHDLALKVDAVLSVSGAVNGSPLADRYYRTKYDNWLAKHSIGKCLPGDGGLLDSLSRVVQIQWLATHPLPADTRYFSVGAFVRHEDVHLLHRYTHHLLSKIDPFNDGQLLMIDQLIPGSYLLGYVNADHWSVAVSMEEKYSISNSRQLERDRIFRDVLFEAMILFVIQNING